MREVRPGNGRGAVAGGANSTHRIHLRLLGDFQLCIDGEEVAVARSHQRLIALLGLHSVLNRERLPGLLWPDCPERKAQASLRTLLWRLGRALPEVVQATEYRVRWACDAVTDVQEWSDAAQQMLADADAHVPPIADSTLGELLPGWYDDWVLIERERIRQRYLHTLELLAETHLALRRFWLALDLALIALGLDPLRESAHRLVIRVHLAEGNVVEARRQYQRCSRLLNDELGVRPSSDLAALMDGVAMR